ncbi:hypothetical protein OF83DRAFT_7310 [Amylostereum chailletii]|nr:hypothetical protein OF83DRAFT_7310 [Amylostereum chailletii]
MESQSIDSLYYLFVFIVVLIFASLAWCILSSCIGKPLMQGLSGLWNAAVESARIGNQASFRNRRPFGPESDIWEMETRRRPG